MPQVPDPQWLAQLKKSYLAGNASVFLLHGNVTDAFGGGDDHFRAEPLAEYLTRRLFGNYDLVLQYDMGRGLRAQSAGDPARLTRMNALLRRLLGEKTELPREPTPALRIVDHLVSRLLVGEENRVLKTAILFDYADLLCPAEERGDEHLATLLNWARNPVIRRVNLVFVLMTESLGRLNSALVQSGHTEEVRIPMPNEQDRRAFIEAAFPQHAPDAARLAALSAGLTLVNLESLMRLLSPRPSMPSTSNAGSVPEQTELVKDVGDNAAGFAARGLEDGLAHMGDIKKRLMEAQCPGLLEFVEPKLDLGMVAGHSAAKERLLNDAQLLRDGNLDAVPMGYLLCGPVGVGKTFMAMCYAGSAGIPCVTIRNFRSKYVGETEANIERVLSVVRELGPVVVIVDEADAALGNRGASGDSGTSARVFAQIASQMGDTRYRGKIVWFLLTCRPDLLPIDLKRQGRCEEHIPLFYPESPEDLREMFLAMGRKAKLDLERDTLPDFSEVPALSGADIEGILMRARRESLLQHRPVDAALLQQVIGNFRSFRQPAHELQLLAAIVECTDMRYLPEKIRGTVQSPEQYEGLVSRLRELQALHAAE